MTEDHILEALRSAGTRAIANDGTHDHNLIPLEQKDVVFKQMFEYPVQDFEAEVGFYATVFGLETIALTDDYALFKHPEHGYCISFRKADDAPALSKTGLKLLFMTADISAADAHLGQTGLLPAREIRQGSPVQEVIYFATPAGVAIEIWEDPSPGRHDN